MLRAPITAIVTAYQRIEQTLTTLQRIKNCEPPPAEILVHVDGNQKECAAAIRQAFPEIKVMVSEVSVGPGGGRNKLIAGAQNELVASFDDDSYPMDADYFARAVMILERFSEASIVCAAVYHREQVVLPNSTTAAWVSDFAGGGCVYRRKDFVATSGFVPLALAYGMEEVDLALRLHGEGKKILGTRWLRVFHDTDLRHHADPSVTATSIANLALLTYLRYPPSCWLIGVGQCLNRILWLAGHGRRRGLLEGLLMIPAHLHRHRQYRGRVTVQSVRSYLALRRAPIPVYFE